MDKLEKYIRDHRDEFNTDEPRNELWDKVRVNLDQQEEKSRQSANWMWKAAAVVLLLTTSVLVVDRFSTKENTVIAEGNNDPFLEEFNTVEQYYLSQIDEMQRQLVSYGNNDLVNTRFVQDLDQLDSLYGILKNDFETNGNNQKIADALIQNLRIRMEIISQQLMILERIKQQTSDENTEI